MTCVTNSESDALGLVGRVLFCLGIRGFQCVLFGDVTLRIAWALPLLLLFLLLLLIDSSSLLFLFLLRLFILPPYSSWILSHVFIYL